MKSIIDSLYACKNATFGLVQIVNIQPLSASRYFPKRDLYTSSYQTNKYLVGAGVITTNLKGKLLSKPIPVFLQFNEGMVSIVTNGIARTKLLESKVTQSNCLAA